MRQVLKWIGIALGVILGILVVGVASAAIIGNSRLNQRYDIAPETIPIPTDAAAIARGQYLVAVSCAGCHGENLGGAPFFQDPAMGSIPAPNLTSGAGGVGATFSDADFVRAIRHGVDSDGRSLAIMPAQAFWHFSDADLGAIIAYLRSAPPVANAPGERTINLLPQILIGAGMMNILAAETIDHNAVRPAAMAQQVDAAYGEYLANTNDCRQCHGAQLSGGRSSEPGAPPGPDLTPGGELSSWTRADFIAAMRSGMTPDGRTLNPQFMPWEDFGRMTDDDLAALFLYLQTLPAKQSAAE